MDAAFDALVDRAIQKRPADRFESAREFADALAEWRVRNYPDFDTARVAHFQSRVFARERIESSELYREYDLTELHSTEDTDGRQYTRLVDVGHFTGTREIVDPVGEIDAWLETRRRRTDGGAAPDSKPVKSDDAFWSSDSRPEWVEDTQRALEMEAIRLAPTSENEVDTGVFEREETTNPQIG